MVMVFLVDRDADHCPTSPSCEERLSLQLQTARVFGGVGGREGGSAPPSVHACGAATADQGETAAVVNTL